MADKCRLFDTHQFKKPCRVLASLETIGVAAIHWHVRTAEADLIECNDAEPLGEKLNDAKPGDISINPQRGTMQKHNDIARATIDVERPCSVHVQILTVCTSGNGFWFRNILLP